MKFWTTKEEVILEGMASVLRDRGYEQVHSGDFLDRWQHPASLVLVDIAYTASTHHPLTAMVSDRPPGVRAWDGASLLVQLEAAEREVVLNAELRRRLQRRGSLGGREI